VALIKGLFACGKTTLLEGIAGFSYSLQSGVSLKMDATLQQKDICYIPSAQVKQDFGGCNIFKFITSGMEVTVDNEKMLRKAAIKYIQALLLVGMDNIDMELPETLSNGQMKRLLLVKGFVQGARLLLLDETISALSADRRGKSESERECCIRVIREYMTEKNAAVICVSH
jgi:ABC-type Mn2+/Zn2+ transport system ATPase subunit